MEVRGGGDEEEGVGGEEGVEDVGEVEGGEGDGVEERERSGESRREGEEVVESCWGERGQSRGEGSEKDARASTTMWAFSIVRG